MSVRIVDREFLDWSGAEGEEAQIVGAFMQNTSNCDDFAHRSASNEEVGPG